MNYSKKRQNHSFPSDKNALPLFPTEVGKSCRRFRHGPHPTHCGEAALLTKLMLLSSKSLSHVSCCKRKHLPRLPHTRDRMNPWMQNKKGNAWKCDVYIYISLGKCQRFETSKYVENQIISNYDVSPWEMGLNMAEPLLPKHCEAVLFFIAVSHTSSLGACSNCETRCQLDQLAASRTLRA